MHLSRYVMMAMLPCALNAAAAPVLAQASDPQAPVPAPVHVSAFAGYHAAPEHKNTPDTLWRQANQEVAGAGSPMAHMGHAEHMEPMAAPAADPAPVRQKAERKAEPVPPADPHHGHDMSKHHQGD